MMKDILKHVTRQELILEEVFLHGDDNEEFPMNVFADDTYNDIMYAVCYKTLKVRVFKLTEDQDKIAKEHRDKILTYRLNNPTDEDDVYLGDIFMQGDHIKELTFREVQNHYLLLTHFS